KWVDNAPIAVVEAGRWFTVQREMVENQIRVWVRDAEEDVIGLAKRYVHILTGNDLQVMCVYGGEVQYIDLYESLVHKVPYDRFKELAVCYPKRRVLELEEYLVKQDALYWKVLMENMDALRNLKARNIFTLSRYI